MTDRFDLFVKEKVDASSESGGRFDPEIEKTVWLDKLDELYALVRRSLATYTDSGSIGVRFDDAMRTEELLGAYSLKEAYITIGQNAVSLKPVGTFLIGARGRVDMQGRKGSIRFLLVPPDATAPGLRVQAAEADPEQAAQEEPRQWAWKIATLPPRVRYLDLTEESFRDALIEVVDG